ncbi:WhiB family transcriptional regulator [Nonomuraea sp. NPDC049725]
MSAERPDPLCQTCPVRASCLDWTLRTPRPTGLTAPDAW